MFASAVCLEIIQTLNIDEKMLATAMTVAFSSFRIVLLKSLYYISCVISTFEYNLQSFLSGLHISFGVAVCPNVIHIISTEMLKSEKLFKETYLELQGCGGWWHMGEGKLCHQHIINRRLSRCEWDDTVHKLTSSWINPRKSFVRVCSVRFSLYWCQVASSPHKRFSRYSKLREGKRFWPDLLVYILRQWLASSSDRLMRPIHSEDYTLGILCWANRSE